MDVRAVLVSQAGAVGAVDVGAVPRVWSRLRGGSRLGRATGPNPDVGDLMQVELASWAAALSLALVVLHPVEVTMIPVTEHDHHLRHVVGHVSEGLAAVSLLHHDLIAALRDRPLVAQEVVVPLLEL